ncbi:ExbD/TolR family protein [Simiduia agarivorans]|uniref:Transport energizing protein, ExbD/TolR family n=1 Tax=Simiduia agarivorans (strain DSM 21679 / JCM 13881 / BCRC 17597 / SA1) TaxID=1117647 RepID=K4KIK0_SIMAS|nr:biopolymer transporter ExbD [Simiduia agarivorans]AFU98851.2 transport energizing protein, ExbD/TolR family [Simiduia agarivorans SA1 = DSM 21679]
MSRRRKHGAAEDNSEIDLTPMLDVVFIMLIFFIVTASFVKEQVIETNIPPKNEQQNPPDDENPSIVVTVRANDEIWMEERRIDIRAVRANIERMHAENPKAAVVVRAHIKSSAKTYVSIADAAREAKVYNVALVPFEEKI